MGEREKFKSLKFLSPSDVSEPKLFTALNTYFCFIGSLLNISKKRDILLIP